MPTIKFLATTVAAVVILLVGDIRTSAADGLSRFLADLEDAGYTATVSPVGILHDHLSVTGKVMSVEKAGAIATVELLDYATRDNLNADWIVAYQQAPRPRQAEPGLANAVLAWRDTAVLVLYYNSGEDDGTAQVAAGVFLGRRGVSFEGLNPRIIPPGTGDGGLR